MSAPTWVFFDVDGVACEGLAGVVMPARGAVPPGWFLVCACDGPDQGDGSPQCRDVFIPVADYQRIVSAYRRPDGPEAHEEALSDHVDRLTEATRVSVDLRYRGLAEEVLPLWYVDNLLAPTQQQRALLTVRDGMVTYDSLVHAGCIPKFGGGSNFSVWAFLPADEVDEAWVEEVNREIAKATAPYRRYLEEVVR